ACRPPGARCRLYGATYARHRSADDRRRRGMGRRAREGFPCSSRRTFAVDPRYIQEVVACPSNEEPEAVVVDTGNRYLYHVRAGGDGDTLRGGGWTFGIRVVRPDRKSTRLNSSHV